MKNDQAGDAEFSSIDDVGEDKAFYKKGIVEKQDKPKKSAIKVGDEFLVGVKWLTLITLLNQVMVLIICV